jgi:sialidase-1
MRLVAKKEFSDKRIRMLFSRLFHYAACAAFITLAGCQHAPGPAPFETILAPSTAAHPRQTEGDIVVLKDGTLLAAWSDFTGGRRDEAAAHISARTSRDSGQTWSDPFVLQENIGQNNVMSVSFLRTHNGDILFFFLVKNSLSDLKVVVRRSTDEAKTWGAPVTITPDPGYHIMNNARVIQLKTGRILCPISFCPDIGQKGSHLVTFICYSDDNGRTWKKGKGMADVPKRGAMEPGLIELKNGTVLQLIRTDLGQIWQSTSADGGDRWSPAEPFGIVAPQSPCTVARLPGTGELVLFYNPSIERGISGMNSRTPLVCSLSQDEGKTWSKPKTVESSLDFTYAYTSVTFFKGSALLTYWHCPVGQSNYSLKFKRLPLRWLRNTALP